MDLLLVNIKNHNNIFTYYRIGIIDYNVGPYASTISAGMTTATFNLTIVNDNILEENEFFYVVINSSSLPNDVSVSSPLQLTVTIANDDCKYCY